MGSRRERRHRPARVGKVNLARLGTLRHYLYLFFDRLIEGRGALPAQAHARKAHHSFVVNHDVSGKCAYAKCSLYASIVIAILRPDHLVLRGKIFPLRFIAVRADAD